MNERSAQPVEAIAPRRSSRTILLVDDQTASRLITKWFLESFGYVVETARGAKEAFASFDPAVHELVMTDSSLPGISATELAHIIRMRSASTPVLCYTGGGMVIRNPEHLLSLKERLDSLLDKSRFRN